MRRSIDRVLILLGVALTVVAALFFIDERNRALFASGPIEKGGRYGVKVGSSLQDATAKLEDYGLVRGTLTSRSRCLGLYDSDNVQLHVFIDYSWRRGTICIASEDGMVTGIDSHFTMGLAL